MKVKGMILAVVMAVVMMACGDGDGLQAEKEKNKISFVIKFVDENGVDWVNSIYSDNLGEYFTVTYKGKVYEVKNNSQNKDGVYLSCYHKANVGRVVEFGGIDGSKEFENESFTIDCCDGKTNVVTFSNRKVNTADGTIFVQDCTFNGEAVDKSQIVCNVGIHNCYNYCYDNFGIIVSGAGWCQIRFMPVDVNGNSLLTNTEFMEKVKSGTTFTYRGITSPIETEYTGSKLKLKVTNESFGELEKEPRIMFGTFNVVKILKDQKLEINWYDGSKDVVDINFAFHYSRLNDSTSNCYDPTHPQNVFDIRVNGEQLEQPYITSSLNSTMVFVYKKMFEVQGEEK